ncbi:adenosine deaminase [Sporichthya brevicatena]|uniref:Adenosine deaminase n=1 Tax=Sporichthya brevicatena TaxID=171442 RepID=A0ABN1GKQ2_9ACTN
MGRRDLRTLPKAHLHLHFTGSMRHATLLDLAEHHGLRLPDQLRRREPLELEATDQRGWFRFQRLYDAARAAVQTEEDIRRLVLEAAQDDAAEGSGWLELQVDPSTYARHLGGLTPTVELILDAARDAAAATGVGIGLILAANRTRHPFDARTLARLAARYADAGVVGFGLSNDERRGRAADFDRAFEIARGAGLAALPHGGELGGPSEVRDCLRTLRAHRIGHGVRAIEDPALLEELAAARITLEVCPASNVALGVADDAAAVPVRTLMTADVPVALGADDPLLFGSRLVDQYVIARDVHGCTDAELADLARHSVEGSLAPEETKYRLRGRIAAWLAEPPPPAH